MAFSKESSSESMETPSTKISTTLSEPSPSINTEGKESFSTSSNESCLEEPISPNDFICDKSSTKEGNNVCETIISTFECLSSSSLTAFSNGRKSSLSSLSNENPVLFPLESSKPINLSPEEWV